jgi:arylsulfatase A-like enzyme
MLLKTIAIALLLAGSGAEQPNVVFLTVDTLRADHLGVYEYRRNTSPVLDELAARSVVFEDAVCEEPQTGPSFISMLTSRFPRALGTTRNGVPVSAEVPVVAESFKEAGYETAALVSNWNLKAPLSGLDRGFALYDAGFTDKRIGVAESERGSDKVTDLLLRWLAERDRARPFFLWAHYMDPHGPYTMHKGFNPYGEPLRELSPVERTRARYDSEIAFTDFHIGRLLDALPKAKTFIVFVADHGESLHEHNYLGHTRRVYQTTMRVPFFISGPGIKARRDASPVRGVDVAPTLLGLAGLPPLEGMMGLDVIREAIPLDRVRVVETYGGSIPRDAEGRRALAMRPPSLQAVIVAPWKLILGGRRPQLFNLAEEPSERKNRARKYPAEVQRLTALIDAWNAANPKALAEAAPLSEEDVEALNALGYLR